MSSNRSFLFPLSVFASVLALGLTATALYGQTSALAVPRVQGPVNESQLTTVKGNTLPVARTSVDHGLVPDGTPTGHMLMVLKRSDAQQKALDALVAAQKDPTSPSYHRWLTPEQLGAQFGVADADVQAVTSYLAAQGFAVSRVFNNKMAVEFAGTTGQVRSAFRTEIHSFAVNGQSFHANVSAPQIPAALASVVKGVTLNNYKPAVARSSQRMLLDRTKGISGPLFYDQPDTANALSPGDLAVIYDIPTTTATGSGVTVGVIGDSNINVAIPANYRTLFGLPANPPTVVVDGTDPGITNDADLAYREIELLAAIAPQAKVNLYTSADTDLDTGMIFATLRALVDDDVQVLVFGFESCEANLGPVFNSFFQSVWEDAAAEGMSVVVDSGTGGAAECDATPGVGNPESVATKGLAVNGYASSPYVTAVGATDFFYTAASQETQYWKQSPDPQTSFTSALSYIPEQPTNSSDQATNVQTYSPGYVQASGGGVSTLGLANADETAGSPYPKPSYQMGFGDSISPSARIVPDVSFFGGNFNNDSTYILCIDVADCVNSTPASLIYSGGGDSTASVAAFGGIAALLVQAHGVQGNLNPSLYATYTADATAFHDVTNGTNSVCTAGVPACTAFTTTSGGATAYAAGPGYDAASGLGSVDVAKLISSWRSTTGTATPTVTLSLTEGAKTVTSFRHDAPVPLNVSVTGGSAAPNNEDVEITITGTTNTPKSILPLTLTNGQATYPGIGGLLPGGSYSVVARYSGNTNYAPATASVPVTVTSVPSKLIVETTDQSNNPIPLFTGQAVAYGTNVHFTFFVYDANDTNDPASATGFVSLTDNGKQIAILPMDSEGFASFSSTHLAGGAHSFNATYSGDRTFNAASLTGGAPSVVITGVPTTTTLMSTDPNPSSANNIMVLVATVTPNQICSPLVPCPTGAAPAGRVRFKDGNKTLGTVTLDQGVNTGTTPTASAALTLFQDTFNLNSAHSIVATYLPAGTGDYVGSSSAPLAITVGGTHGEVNTTLALATTPENAINFIDTSTVTFDAIVRNGAVGAYGAPTGTVTFFSNGTTLGQGTLVSPGVWSFTMPDDPTSGLLALPLGQSRILAQYSGDSGHAASSSTYSVNVYDQTSTPDFAMQSNLTTQVLSPSIKTAPFTLQFTSMSNFSALAIPIKLSYTGPAGISCASSPTAPNFGNTLYAKVNFTCRAASGFKVGQLTAPAIPGKAPRGLWMAEGGAALACVLLFGIPGRRRRWQSLLGSVALFVVAFGVTGCGGMMMSQQVEKLINDSNARDAAPVLAPGTYTVIVTGTASVFTRSQTNTTVNVVHNIPLQVVVK
jgi:trimeric autotransporter adhesin